MLAILPSKTKYSKLRFTRTYNSQDTYSGALGTNWTHSYNFTVGANSTGAVVKWGDGHGENYTLSGGVYVPAPGVTSALTQNPTSGVWTLTRKDGTQFAFEPFGKLQYVRDRNGNSTWLSYDSKGETGSFGCAGGSYRGRCLDGQHFQAFRKSALEGWNRANPRLGRRVSAQGEFAG